MGESTADAQLSPMQQQQITETMFDNITSQALPNIWNVLTPKLTEFCEQELFPHMKKDLFDAALKMMSETKCELRENFN